MRLARGIIVVAAALAAGALAAAPAQAKPIATDLGNVADSNSAIQLAGDRVVFLNRPQFTRGGSIDSVPAAGGKRRRLVSLQPTLKDGELSIRFDAVAGRLGYGVTEYLDPEGGQQSLNVEYAQVRSGPLDGPYDRVDGCDQPARSDPRDVRVSATAIFHMGFGCDSAPLTARGLAPPGYVRQLEDPSLVGFAASASMAGDFLAYARGTAGGTRVFNHAAGATAAARASSTTRPGRPPTTSRRAGRPRSRTTASCSWPAAPRHWAAAPAARST